MNDDDEDNDESGCDDVDVEGRSWYEQLRRSVHSWRGHVDTDWQAATDECWSRTVRRFFIRQSRIYRCRL